MIQGFQRGGVQLGVVRVMLQIVAHVLDLRQSGLQGVCEFGVAGLDVLLRLQPLQCPVDAGGGAVVVVIQGRQGLLGGIDEALRMRQPAMLKVELLPLPRLGRELVELAQLPLQALAFFLHGGLARSGFVERALGFAPGRPAVAQGPRVEPGVIVQQLAHGVGAGQALPGVLAVDVHQFIGQGLELAGRGGAAVDPGAAAALMVHLALELQWLSCWRIKAMLLQPLGHRRTHAEFGHDFAARCPFAHHRGIGASAQHQLQGIDEDGFARAGLAGQHGKPRVQIQIERLHDHKVAQRHALPTQLTTPSFQCSLRRKVSK